MKVKYFGTEHEVYVKEPRIIPKALKYCRNHRTVIQAGGHVGVWPNTLQTVFDKVVSFEPKFESWKAAQETFDLSYVLTINGALGEVEDVNGVAGGPFDGSGHIQLGAAHCTMYTIDGLPRWLTNDLDLIMLDIEGYELNALKGAAKTIDQRRPVIVLEAGKLNDTLFEQFLTRFRYKVAEEAHRDLILVPQ